MTKEERKKKAILRLKEMKKPEEELYNNGIKVIAGMDEAGRGPLAGPVVAAAVILPPDFNVPGVDDSKRLTEKKREALYEVITDQALSYSIGIVDNYIIDDINILGATRLAMKQAINRLKIKPEYILIDALTLKDIPIPQRGIIKGDSISISIAAASIIAKVTRDRMMKEFHKRFPQYALDRNKGYGTKEHLEGIASYGPCLLHRKSFIKKYYSEDESEQFTQLTFGEL
ncbi:MAG TPA: ribonuclease HII [Clostridiales bacterium]|jgi:ribonuclease HII|nr:ribonuclease HII [Clostridiales bacterium]